MFSSFMLISLILICILYKRRMMKYKHLPPGPFALPIIGSIPFLKGKGGPVGEKKEEKETWHQMLMATTLSTECIYE